VIDKEEKSRIKYFNQVGQKKTVSNRQTSKPTGRHTGRQASRLKEKQADVEKKK
jgi:hypothetical protein